MKKLILSTFVLTLLAVTTSFATNVSPMCNTSWEGYYFYPASVNDKLESAPVRFDLKFSCSNNVINGRITEPNTFGDKTSSTLNSNISVIDIGHQKVDFMKIYDGTAGVKHSVHYEGELITNRFVYGKWKIIRDDGSVYSGFFEMHR